ncbi:MAG: nitrate reductase molybdenum cofactor assembly chaperone [Methylococcales bacterium]|nr:nitrate reductase molybdenum cofactor assembly chaperone [Methylococcales bacterium]
MQIYKILSLLLEYPKPELFEHWSEIKQLIPTLELLTEEDQAAFSEFMSWAGALSLTEYQAHYVNTFDFTPENALYLTHHLFEEQDRERGPALVDLSEYYKAEGFEISDGELPDYLPLVLEYVSTLGTETDIRLFLQQSAHVSDTIAQNLEKINSPYAPLLRIVQRHGRLVDIAA